MRWILEKHVMDDLHKNLATHVAEAGYEVVWWQDGDRVVADELSVFHGSLEVAHRFAQLDPSAAYCDVEAFYCRTWYAGAVGHLIHERFEILPLRELVENKEDVFARLDLRERAFFRPSSPLKPFSGRVLTLDQLTLAGLDYGFYYEDDSIDVVVAPVRNVGEEFRFVVVDGRVVSGSGYVADGRDAASTLEGTHESWRYAQTVAEDVSAPERVFVLDVGHVDDKLRLLELNPFSGADLYACNLAAIVAEV